MNSETLRLVVVEGGGRVSGQRIVVNSGERSEPCPALLRLNTGSPEERIIPVWLTPTESVPPDVIGVGQDLLERHDYEPDAPWEIQMTGFQVRPVSHIVLAPQLELDRQMDHVAKRLRKDATLNGHLVYSAGDDSPPDVLTAADEFFEVVDICTPESHGDFEGPTVFQLTSETQFELDCDCGMDIVILADCSASMSIADQVESAEKRGESEVQTTSSGVRIKRQCAGRPITRLRALQRALSQFLDVRRQSPKTRVRVALVAFYHDVAEQIFPLEGGLVELAVSEDESLQGFEKATLSLKAMQCDTRIGVALDYAGDLLQQYHREGNQQVIVLVSDGAEFRHQDDSATGEFVLFTEAPEQVLDSLQDRLSSLHLNAVGIGTESDFQLWLSKQTPQVQSQLIDASTGQAMSWAVPRHDLLQRLQRQGGGDPATVGSLDVLKQCFEQLGKGVRHRVGTVAAIPTPELSRDERDQLANHRDVAPSAEMLLELERQRQDLLVFAKEYLHRCQMMGRELCAYDNDLCHESFRRSNGAMFRMAHHFDPRSTVASEEQFKELLNRFNTGLIEDRSDYFFGEIRGNGSTQKWPTEPLSALEGKVSWENLRLDSEGYALDANGVLGITSKPGKHGQTQTQKFAIPRGAQVCVEDGQVVKAKTHLFFPYPALPALFQSGLIRDIKALRNSSFHARGVQIETETRDRKEFRRLKSIYSRLGVPDIPLPREEVGWRTCEINILMQLSQLFERIIQIIRENSPIHSTPRLNPELGGSVAEQAVASLAATTELQPISRGFP